MGTEKKISTQVMDLQQLIGAPLIATIEADALSSQRYLEHLFNIAFEGYDPVTGKTGELRKVTFRYTATDNGRNVLRSVSIPLLSLVPLPLLQVQQAEFDFDIRILEACYTENDKIFSFKDGKMQNKISGEMPGQFTLRASLAPNGGESKKSGGTQRITDANMKVRIRMQQADMPAGLANLLQLTASNMQLTTSLESSDARPPE